MKKDDLQIVKNNMKWGSIYTVPYTVFCLQRARYEEIVTNIITVLV